MKRQQRFGRAACATLLIAACAAFGPRFALAEAVVDGHDVTFRLDARKWPVKPKRVNVVGSFQGWEKAATPLKDAAHDGVWTAKVHVAADGPQGYKFVVDGTRYLPDETGDRALESDDSFGGKNSGFVIGAAAAKAGGTVFTLDTSTWQRQPKTVSVAGEFNAWNPAGLAMARAGTLWTATATLPEGTTHYKFVVDGERWITDPKADPALEADDGNGGKNSGVNVATPAAAATQASAAASSTDQGFEFTFDASPFAQKPTSVAIAGDFNGWSMTATPLAQAGNFWSVRVPIPEGTHSYKFVLDGSKWTNDPKSDPKLDTDDGNGGRNSGVVVGPDGRKLPPAKPDDVNASAIRFSAADASDLNVVSDDTLRLRLRVQANDVQHVYIRTGDASTDESPRVEMQRLSTAYGYDTYAALVRVPKEKADKPLGYAFELVDGTADVFWSNGHVFADAKAAIGQGEAVSMKPTFVTPDWAKSAVWYQIFPERFRNGDKSNDPGDQPNERLISWTSDWWKPQPGESTDPKDFYDGKGDVWNRRYGGDIQGIRAELPYLRELGVNAIYLNPIFEAQSMHKYDATDYRHVDDNFGVKGDLAQLKGETDDPKTWQWTASDKVFLDFVADAHRQGFKVILDGVFNHVGRDHVFFQDVLANGKNSKYATWFEITDWGDPKNWHKMADPMSVHGKPGGIQWKAWDKDNGFLPALKHDPVLGLAHGPREHVLAVVQRWLAPDGDASRGVDGWRLDAANEVPHGFWDDFRDTVKKAKPDAYITGEIWPWAQAWINDGKQFDAVMNYQFAMPAQQFFVNTTTQIKPSVFAADMVRLEMAYPFQAALVQQNLYDSHDTDRLASMFVNPNRDYDAANRPQDNAKDHPYSPAKPTDEQWTRMKQAAAMQFTYVGAPMIYYGDECGMWGPDDPSDRQPMIWRDLMPYADPQVAFKPDLFAYYERLIALRAALPALRDGFFAPLMFDDVRNVLVFRRGSGPTAAYVAINRSAAEASVDVPISDADATGPLVNWLDNAQATLDVPDTKDSPTARPTLKLTGKGGVTAHGGAARVTLPAYGTAVLSVAKP